jgi:hypothetical protein
MTPVQAANLINQYSQVSGIYALLGNNSSSFKNIFTTLDTTSPNAISSFTVSVANANGQGNVNFATGNTPVTALTFDVNTTPSSNYIVYTQSFPEGFGGSLYATSFNFSYNLNAVTSGTASGGLGFNSVDLISVSHGQNQDLSPGPVIDANGNSVQNPTHAQITNAINPQNVVAISGADYFQAGSETINTLPAYGNYNTLHDTNVLTAGADHLTGVAGLAVNNYDAFIFATSHTVNGATTYFPDSNYATPGGADVFFTSNRAITTSDLGYNVLDYYSNSSQSISYQSSASVSYIGSATNFDYLVGGSGNDYLYSSNGATTGSADPLVNITIQTSFNSPTDLTSSLQTFAVRDVLVGGNGNDTFYTNNSLIQNSADSVGANANNYAINASTLVIAGPGNNDIYTGHGGDIILLSGATGLQAVTTNNGSVTNVTAGEALQAMNSISGNTNDVFRLTELSGTSVVPAVFDAGTVAGGGSSSVQLAPGGTDIIHYSLASVIADDPAQKDIVYFFQQPDKIDLSLLLNQLGVPEADRTVFSTNNPQGSPGVIYLQDISSSTNFNPLAGSGVTTGTNVSIHYGGHIYSIADVYGVAPSQFVSTNGHDSTASNFFITG